MIVSDDTYVANNPTWHTEDSPWKAAHILKAIAKLPTPPRTICEVGCGAGEILRQLQISFPDANLYGYDPSPQALSLASARGNERLRFDCTSIPSESYDLILAVDVIEHVEDIFGFLRAIREHAKYFIFHIPLELNVEYLFRNMLLRNRKSVGHIHYFTGSTALALLNDCGYHVTSTFYTFVNSQPRTPWYRKISGAGRQLVYMLPFAELLIGGRSMMVTAIAERPSSSKSQPHE